MLDLGSWIYPVVIENDPADFKMPYRLHGRVDRENMMARYMRLENLEKPTIVYPAITNFLS